MESIGAAVGASKKRFTVGEEQPEGDGVNTLVGAGVGKPVISAAGAIVAGWVVP